MNPEQLRRALSRRNEATHPVEVPEPADESRLAHDTLLRVTGNPPHRRAADVENLCDVCGLGDEPGDPVGHFKNPAVFGAYLLAHGDCGESNGLELA